MKKYRNFNVFSMFLLLFLFSASGSIAAPQNYPNLLDNDQTATDFLDQPAVVNINDPLEPMNRAFFQFNDKFYEWLLKPVTDVYMWVLPFELRDSINNFFLNLAMPVRLVNTLLQGNLEASGVVLERFLINTTLGVYGFADIADEEFDIEPRHADFGQTLGKWGMGEGIYLCWPIIGPSSARDTAGFVADSYASVIPYIDPSSSTVTISYYSTNMVNKVSLHPDAYDELKRYSLDPYIASRQAYYEYRKALIDRP